jgi:hypothetical protein
MELAGVLSNSETAARLGRVRQAVAGLPPGHGPQVLEPPPAQGEVLRAIKAVLAGYPAGLRTTEIWELVVARLGRVVSYSTIKADLADNVRAEGCFERLRRGVYRVK